MLKRRKNETGWTSAQTLSEALPFIQRYAGQTIVIKFGGNAMGDAELTRQFARDVVLLKQFGVRPVIVHGGGPQIGSMLTKLNIKSEFVDGLRVSDMETVGVAEMVLSGAINKTAKAKDEKLGFTGVPVETDTSVLDVLAAADPGFIPVVSPISGGAEGASYNVNADTAAGTLAGALKASRLMLLTDIEGVMDKEKNLLTNLSADDARGLIKDGTAQGGMIPKLNTAIDAVEAGVEAVVILDGRRAHGLLVELFTDQGAGTLIR